jgi:hypothetical protein
MPTEAEMMADLAAADSAGDTELAQAIASRIKAARVSAAPRMGDLQAAEAGRMPQADKRAEAIRTAINVPAHLLTGYPIDQQRAEAFANAGKLERPLTGRQAAQGMALAGSFLAPALAAGPYTAGAIGGGLTALGTTDAQTVPEAARDAAVGTGLGIAGTGVMKGLGYVTRPAREWVAGKLGGLAEKLAVRSAGADRTAMRRAFKGSEDAVRGLGRFMLDEDMPLRSPAGIRDAAARIGGESGDEIGRLITGADATGTTVDLAAAVNAAKASRAVERLSKNTVSRASHEQIIGMLDDQIAQHGGQVPPSVAHDIRMQLDDLADWDQAAPKAVRQAWRAARREVNDALDAAMGKAGAGDEWATANARFGSSRKLTNPKKRGLADIGAERRSGNSLLSPTEKGGGLIGALLAASGEPASGAALAGGTVLARRFGAPVAARTFDAMSRMSAPNLSPVVAPAASAGFTDDLAELIAALRGPRLRLVPAAAEEDRR